MWQTAKLFIIDEFSMVDMNYLALMAKRIRQARSEESHPQPFGTLHVLFVGDQYQFAPVGGVALHRRLDGTHSHGGNQTSF